MPSSDKKNLSDPSSHEISVVTQDDIENFHPSPKAVPGTEITQIAGQNIVTVSIPYENTVDSFEPNRIRNPNRVKYSELSANFNDPNEQKNARFRLNDLTRKPLSVVEEEEERIEKEVQRRLDIRLEKEREQAKMDAYQAGFATGKEEGIQKVNVEAKPNLERLAGIVRAFESASTEILKANEEFLIHLAYRIAKMIVLKELKEDADYTRRLALNLLERMGTRENIKIFVSEKAFSAAEQLKAGLAQTLGQLKNISVEIDATILDASCRVETDFGEVDAKIEEQLQSIAATLGVATETSAKSG